MRESPTHLFREACGLSSPWILSCQEAASEDELESRLRLSLPFVLVGREVKPGLRLGDQGVSRRHAYLQVVDGRTRVFDLESREGVAWEDAEAERSGSLGSGEGILIGPYRLSWRPDGDRDEGPRTVAEPSSAALVLPIRVGGRDAVWRLEDEVGLVGRASGCGLVLADESVSRFHAAFVRTPLGVWVVDLQTREGVTVSGVRVRWAWLAHGDTVRIGRVMLGFRYTSPPSGISRQDVPLNAGALETGEARTSIGAPGRRPTGRELQVREAGTAAVPSRMPTASGVADDAPAMGLWRRQVEAMESFHDDMALMARMFFAMHQDQLASVRDEMARLETLTAELDSLKARLERTEARQGGGDERAGAGPARPAAAGPTEAAASIKKPLNETPMKQGPDGADFARKKQAVAAEDDPALVHGVIIHRIASLQRERRSCWQRILGRIQP